MNKFPARIHALLARDKDIGVILRRGPSKQVATYLWDRKKNTFTLGQWLKGNIYERRCDISPDGKYMIYFAMNGRWKSETKGSWTAISKTPWLKAIGLYAKGDCWEGGGLFLDNKRFWLNDRYFNEQNTLIQPSGVTRAAAYKPDTHYGSECTGVYYVRLQRDGWVLEELKRDRAVFTKPLPKAWTMKKICHVGGRKDKTVYWDEHEFFNKETKEAITCPEWEWAEMDNQKVVYAEKGCLYTVTVKSSSKICEPKLLYDFNNEKFEERIAPY